MNHNILQPHKFQIAYGYLSFVSPTGIVNSDLDIVIYQPDDNGLFISREIKIPYRFHGKLNLLKKNSIQFSIYL